MFDTVRHRAHSLNATAARVWRACDGQRDLAALADHCQLDRANVELALARLQANHLLDDEAGVSRRTALRRTLIAGASAGVALPILRSITAPTPALAFSGSCAGAGESCGPTTPCCSSGVCNALQSCTSTCEGSGGACSGSGVCCSGLICTGGPPSSFCLPPE